MATYESIMEGARQQLRDFPKHFSAAASTGLIADTYRLPHNKVLGYEMRCRLTSPDLEDSVDGFYVLSGQEVTDSTFLFNVDERNGLLKIEEYPTGTSAEDYAGWGMEVEGYFVSWVTDDELHYHAQTMVAQHAYHRSDFVLEAVSHNEERALILGTCVEACYALLSEFSRDIDVNTPEGISLPTTQRFRQVQQLLLGPDGLQEKYKHMALMLGIGLDRIEVGVLRRVSRTTNRLVPVYRPREWDDASRPARVFPPIDDIGPSTPPEDFVPAAFVTGYYEMPEAGR
jgi:hypothetical protein